MTTILRAFDWIMCDYTSALKIQDLSIPKFGPKNVYTAPQENEKNDEKGKQIHKGQYLIVKIMESCEHEITNAVNASETIVEYKGEELLQDFLLDPV